MFSTRRLWIVAALAAATVTVTAQTSVRGVNGGVGTTFRPVQSIVGDAGFPLCFGDGTSGKCPAANPGLPGRGCDNSTGGGGALLAAHGFPSLTDDTLLLTVDGLPPGTTAVYLQGWKLASPPKAFGDGLLCLAGTTLRLGAKTANGGSSSFPGLRDPNLSVVGKIPGPGTSVLYQVLYREKYPFNRISRSNLSNAWWTSWAP